MMEFLDKIYGYEYFGMILFGSIVVLAVLFFIVLFFGKKDEQKRELEETKKLEQQNLNTFAVEPTEVAVEVPAPIVDNEVKPNTETINNEAKVEPVVVEQPIEIKNEEPTFEPIVNDTTMPVVEQQPVEIKNEVPAFEPIVTDTTMPVVEGPILPPVQEAVLAPVIEPTVEPQIPVFEEPVPVEQPIVEEQPAVAPIEVAEPTPEKAPVTEIPNFNFDELAASIASELEEIEQTNTKVEEKAEIPVVGPKTEDITKEEVVLTPMSEVIKPKPTPVTFSSVYVNKPVEEQPAVTPEFKEINPVANSVEAPVINKTVEPVPTRPTMELPKAAEMPKVNTEASETPQTVNPSVPDFSQFEGESYNIK